jgi:hypothetical protein
MAKFSLFVRNLHLHPIFKSKLEASVEETDEVKPGQLRKRGDWYFLTYLRTVVLKNFNPASFETTDKELNQIKACAFQIHPDKLLVRGSKGDLKEIIMYFQALGEPLTSDTIPLADLFKITEPIVALENILTALESKQVIDNVRKIRMKKVEVKIGHIDNCVIVTNDYGAVQKLLNEHEEGEESPVFGMEVFLKTPEKTSVYYDLDGQIRITTKNQNTDPEELAIEYATA